MVFIEVTKCMYGLPQDGLLANELLEHNLNKHGYFQSKLIPEQWIHETRPIRFTFVFEDFDLKYVGKEHAHHLEAVLKEHYKIKADSTGTRYVGIHHALDNARGSAHLYMPGYGQNAKNIPFSHTQIQYVRKKQLANKKYNKKRSSSDMLQASFFLRRSSRQNGVHAKQFDCLEFSHPNKRNIRATTTTA